MTKVVASVLGLGLSVFVFGCVGSTADATSSADAGSDAGSEAAVAVPESSCAGALMCGFSNATSCCESPPVEAGSYGMGRGPTGLEATVCSTWGVGSCGGGGVDDNEVPEHPAKVSAFSLDTFEVTVGRFRNFVAGYPDNRPKVGDGAHPVLAASGWTASMDANLPTDQAALVAKLSSCGVNGTWTAAPTGVGENKPISCVSWYEAFAFCAWDKGRLPTEAEWEYAASAGRDQAVPWSVSPSSTTPPTEFEATWEGALLPVGSARGGKGRWGQLDMLGNVSEWVLDWYGPYTSATCADCARLEPAPSVAVEKVVRGGSVGVFKGQLRSTQRAFAAPPVNRSRVLGFRCAR